MRPPQAVLFDFDGTLADTAPDMLAALDDWLAARNRPPADPQHTKNLCSGGSRALLSLCGWDGEIFEDARDDYLARYEATAYQQTTLFDGVAEMLAQINQRQLPWGIVTNKPRRYFAPIAERLQLTALGAKTLVCGDDHPHAKPHPMSLLAAAEACGIPPEQCVYVGDDVRDAHAAAAANMAFIGTIWGYWQPPQWGKNPPPVDAYLSAPHLLTKILENFQDAADNQPV